MSQVPLKGACNAANKISLTYIGNLSRYLLTKEDKTDIAIMVTQIIDKYVFTLDIIFKFLSKGLFIS